MLNRVAMYRHEDHVACQEGYSQIVSKLLEHNGDVNRCNNDGMSPLYLACQEGHLQVVCTLLEHAK
jgi:ankyrin repeat protein